MSIVYSVIARYPDIVLCEFSEVEGNFPVISTGILKTVVPDSKQTILYDG